jgi:outer membrane protein assembly factor BamB
MNRRLLLGSAALMILSVTGCSWFGGGGDDDATEPYPLSSFKPEVDLKKLWDVKVGKGVKDRFDSLSPVIIDGRIFAASADGKVLALNVATGRKIWETRIDRLLSDDVRSMLSSGNNEDRLILGGVGGGTDLVLVTTTTGEIIALNQSDGSFAWRSPTSSEVLVPPQVNDELVVTQSIDGKIVAYDVLDGTPRWTFSTSVPILTLRGTSTPLLADDFVLVGFANGRVALLDTEQGLPRWEQRVALPQGKSELERLVDVDGEMILTGNNLFAASYQGNLVSIAMSDGRINWQREASSSAGLSEGFGNIYIANADSSISAVDSNSYRDVWSVDALTNRDITTPVTLGNHVAVGDYDGYIHLLAQLDGRFTGRRKVDSEGIRATPVVQDGRLFILGNSGRLTALEIR